MIKVITNNLGSGDWIQVRGNNDNVIWEGHRLSVYDLQYVLNIVSDTGAELKELTDEQMEALQ
jgi:hypothetical protein